ncbi:hypothetical protein CYMTET_19238 [Cymbomonas tetramitiformis]|uniref:Uncharacterized protein n=1 Tax=Cymbomonas tetramitiformis TaxID=36881 RepID=A0AAE0L5H7_9CHLO|nr:hypothetical protein CYMTET_19238 [Cymbomonas tetramitiformis]
MIVRMRSSAERGSGWEGVDERDFWCAGGVVYATGGEVYATGANSNGQLGTRSARNPPVRVMAGHVVAQATAGDRFTVFVTSGEDCNQVATVGM